MSITYDLRTISAETCNLQPFFCNARWTGHFGCTIHRQITVIPEYDPSHSIIIAIDMAAGSTFLVVPLCMMETSILLREDIHHHHFYVIIIIDLFIVIVITNKDTYASKRSSAPYSCTVWTQFVVCTITIAPQSPLIEEVSSLLNISSCLNFLIIYTKLRKQNMR